MYSNSDPTGIETDSKGEAMTTSLTWVGTGTFSEVGTGPAGEEVSTYTFLSQHSHYEGGEEGEAWGSDNWWWQHGKVRFYLRDTAPGAPAPAPQTMLAVRVSVEWIYDENIQDWVEQPDQVLEIKPYVLSSSSNAAEELTVTQDYTSNNGIIEESVRLLPFEVIEEIETGESAGCTGYDKDEKALMVPMQGSNKIRVKVGAPADLLSKIKFVASDPSKLSIQPETPTSSDQVLTLSGSTEALGVKIQLDMNGSRTDLFEADVLKRLEKTIEIHAITEENDDVQVIAVGANGGANQICVSAGTNGFRDTIPNGDDGISGNDITTGSDGVCNTTTNNQNLVPTNVTTAQALQAYLNDKTWGNQANVHFTVTRTDHTVNYDLDRNKKLADEFDLSATRVEDDAITATARNSNVDFNVYYVDEHEYPIGITLRAQVFTQGSAPGLNSVLNHTSHEVGHLLGRIGHNGAGADAVMHAVGLPSNPCRILRSEWQTVNP